MIQQTNDPRNRVEPKRRYDNSNFRFKTFIIRSSLCDYSDAYILVKETITIPNTGAAGVVVNNTIKKLIFKGCAPFTDCTTEINETQVDDAQKIDILMLMYNLIEHADVYLKTQEVYGNTIEMSQS